MLMAFYEWSHPQFVFDLNLLIGTLKQKLHEVFDSRSPICFNPSNTVERTIDPVRG
jgi:hypothetical protein